METTFKGLKIAKIATVLPSNKMSLLELGDIYGDSEVRKIIKTTGIEFIHKADETTTASDLCYHAALKLFEKDVDKDEIDGLIFVSQTRDFILPQTSHVLQDRLNLKENTFCLDIPAGCSGYIYGLFQAGLLISSGACSNVLVLAGDTTTRIVNEKDRASRMVFGDAGSATLVTKGDDEMAFNIKAKGAGKDDLIVPAGAFRNPSNETTSLTMPAEEGCARSKEDLYMDGMAVFNFAITKVPKLIEETLATLKWNKNELDAVVLHQANQFMINYISKKIKLGAEKVIFAAKNYGNTGPASIPLAISEKFNDNNLELKKILLTGFGVGLSWGACNCDLSQTQIFKPDINENL